MSRAEGPFCVVKRINNNAYKIDLLVDYKVSSTLNVQDHTPDVNDENPLDYKTNLLQEKGNYEQRIQFDEVTFENFW